MSRVQKDRLLKLGLKEKKLIRLLYHKDLSEEDTIFLNTIYEEKQYLHFTYALALPCMISLSTNYALFRQNSKWMQVGYVAVIGLSMHLYCNSKVNNRFYNLTQPFFKKYEIN
ncbi:unnamed protein product (macronuclear) [Paramecium tetraurelia]|uniref:Uncharacterized protein n=1 Tax=Paramecium tetraurelia TaxID=5888 RepID=A0DRQ7_PARTE|nr:uncharacterized protein GSPATT00019442001 [Paramecium tetraurelia]CAK85724.1 unnamed protein product [Paramecium tetraurelia]|eukprot:XP_001453121.1 hypothetical protein (macronuclear) [Paramecium tetraurelia strain d4-2]